MIYSYVDSPGSEGGVAMIEYNVGLEDDATDFCTAFDVSLQVGRTDNHSLISPLPLHEQQNSANPPADVVGHSARQDLFAGDGTVRPPDPYVGMSFDSEEAVKTYYVAYASSIGFAVRISRSRRSKKDETVIMLRFVCSKEGYYNKKDRSLDGKKKRKGPGSIREGCKAMLEVRKNVDDQWVVTKYLNEHNHELGVPSKVRYIATEGDTEIEPFLGMEFETYEAAKTYYYTYASRVGFDARVRQSRRSARDESFVMRRFVCRKEGFHVDEDGNGTGDDGKKKAKKIIEKEGCQAVFEIIRKDYDRWVVTKLVTEHTHPLSPAPPNEVRCIRSQGEMLVIAKSFTDIVKKAVAPNGTMPMLGDSCVREVLHNAFLVADAQSLVDFFKGVQSENPAFYYAIQLDIYNCLGNVFWADAKARMAYYSFGDTVIFNASYRNGESGMPFATFTGVNHHLQTIVFGCALLIDETEASLVWLFESWLAAMGGRHPVSFVTGLDKAVAVAAAVATVFPKTRHRYCKWDVLGKCMEKLSHVFEMHAGFEGEMTRCVNESGTVEAFKSCWESILDKYDLREDPWMQYVYDIRQSWVSVYLKDTFFAELSADQRPEGLHKVVEKISSEKVGLPAFVKQFGQAIAFENEAQEDYATMSIKPDLKTPSPMEKQAAEVYTRTVFDKFQVEFVESFGYYVENMEDKAISTYRVIKDEDPQKAFVVTNSSDRRARCSCSMFEFAGILCRHILKVFVIVGVRDIPKHCFLKRWTRNARSIVVADESESEFQGHTEESVTRYSDLRGDAIRCAQEGAISVETYKIAKEALQKALTDVLMAKIKQRKLQQQLVQNSLKPQKMLNKKPLPKLTQKKLARRRHAEDEEQEE